jgi:hypothetical protein
MVKRLMSDKDYYLSQANRPLPANKFSQYRGVQKSNNPKKPYRAALRHKGQAFNLGNFADEVEASRAYNKAALAIIGDYALINEIPSDD